jgi:hypothetical protein
MNDKVYISVESVTGSTPGTVLLGVSLTVLPGSLPIGDSLKPWLWKIQSWVVVASPDGSSWTKLPGNSQYKHMDLPKADDETSQWSGIVTATRQAIENAIGKINDGPAGLPPGDPLQAIDLTDDQSTPATHKYLTLLANAAAGPYPVPQNLNLSFFLEVPGATQYSKFLVAPILIAGGVTYDPSGQPLPTSSVWDLTVSGLGLHAQFSTPDATSEIPASLWLPPISGGNSPLVADWSAHVYDLIAPSLDLPHVLSSLDDAALSTILPDNSPNWPIFRLWVLRGLQELITAAVPPANEPAISAWCSTLRIQLGRDFAQLPALNPDDKSSRSFGEEIADIRKIVSAATSGSNLLAFVQGALPANQDAIPARLLVIENAPQLLNWLEIQLSIPYSKSVAAACSKVPTDFKAIAAELCTKVISPHLLYRATKGLDPFAGPAIPAWVQAVNQSCLSKIQQALGDALSRRALGKSDSTSYPSTTVAPPLVVPVMQLRSSGDLSSDPLHAVRGVGVLLRRFSKKPMNWSCLNVVAPAANAKLALLVASRLGYNQKLLTGFLLYNNGPLPCENFLHNYMDPADRLAAIGMTKSQAVNGITPILRYVPYEGSTPGLFGTPMLEAGESYEVACFAVSNSGALPKELRAEYPAKLKPLLSADALPGASATQPNGVVQKIAYFRTVPVCTAEVRDGQGRPIVGTDGFFPRIPPNVWPRAIDTVVPLGGVGVPQAPNGSAPAKPSTLLVVPSTSQRLARAPGTVSIFSLSLKLSSVEPQTWDRTVGYRLPDQTLRAQILDASYINLASRKQSEITDPLITGMSLSLYRWAVKAGSGGWGSPIGAVSYSVSELRKATSGIESVSTNAVGVSLNAGTGSDDGSLEVSVLSESPAAKNPKSLVKSLAEGEVYLLEVTFPLDKNAVTKTMPGYSRSAALGYQLLIEIASAKMPLDLMSPFTVTPVAVNGIPDQRVTVQLKADSSVEWRNIHRVDFLRQSWKWTGRTQPLIKDPPEYGSNLAPGYYPATQAQESKLVRKWEKIEFAERSPVDRVEFTSVLREGVFSWDQDLSLDPRASFLRFAPRIYSRYEGAFAARDWYVAATVGSSERDDSWSRCFLRSRVQKLTMPRLKALIPMTESAFALGTPGILAVFDGPAYEQAGLAERLMVSVATVKDPDLTIAQPWNQSGPDFLMSPESVDSDPKKQVLLTLLPIGPIGHTLDSPNSGFPKFSSHSWIIRPVDPKNPENPGRDFSWWFANLEFKLVIDEASSVFKGASTESQSTVGSWIQFLPGFQDAKNRSDDFIHWSLQWKSGVIVIANEEKKAVAPGNREERHTRHYLLVTRTVLDISGTTREAYVGVAEFNGSNWSLFPDVANSVNERSELHGRFLDVRAGEIGSSHDKRPASDVEFWGRILGRKDDGITDESRASLISLSPAIHQKEGLQ